MTCGLKCFLTSSPYFAHPPSMEDIHPLSPPIKLPLLSLKIFSVRTSSPYTDESFNQCAKLRSPPMHWKTASARLGHGVGAPFPNTPL